MTRDPGRRPRRTFGASSSESLGRGRRLARTPAVEPLEGRALLSSFYSGPTPIRPVQGPGGMYTLTMSGPGLEKVQRLRGGSVGITVFGTTPESVLNVALTRPRLHAPAASLPVAWIRVVSGTIGGITAGAVTLNGPLSPLSGLKTLEFGGLGANAQIDVNGSLGSLAVGSMALGPGGHVDITGDLAQSLLVGGPIALNGGRFSVGHDLTGTLTAGGVTLTQGGAFLVGHDLTGGATVNGEFTASGFGTFAVGHNLGGLNVTQGVSLDSGGQLHVGGDLTGAVNVGGNLNVGNAARLSVVRDLNGTLTVGGDLNLASGGSLAVGRTMNALTVGGNVTESGTSGGITVGGDLTKLTVDGSFTGKGSRDAIDLSVGLNLGSLTVLGGVPNSGGLRNANIDVGKQLLGLNVPHGIFDSWITAGVLIDGSNGGTGGNVGADGPDAIVNSDIRAGVEINHLTINGNVRSTFAADPNSPGYRTRIVAGEDRAGDYSAGGLIDNFQITGSLIDSVVAASVAPYGGNGSLPASGYGAPPSVASGQGDLGYNTYDAPFGYIIGGTVGSQVKYPNFSEVSYYNETLVPNPPKNTFYNTSLDPTIDDAILPGAINPSFASPPLSQTALTTSQTITTTSGGQNTTTTLTSGTAGSSTGTQVNSQSNNGTTTTTVVTPNDQVLPLPAKSTVLGGVISTKHGDEADFAGLFAADTRGVFVGTLPQ